MATITTYREPNPAPKFDCLGPEHSSKLDSDDRRLQVTVIQTTTEGTIAALRAAANLAWQLRARIVLLAIQVVPLRLPLNRPPVCVKFLQQQLLDLVCESSVRNTEVVVQVALCRDRDQVLKRLLSPHSLVVVGGSRQGWLRRERKLERYLRRLGHEVVSVDVSIGPIVRHALAHLRLPSDPAYFKQCDLGGNEK
jgi:hypothetical protein